MKLDIVKDRSILIDTSVWIDYFKGSDAQFAQKVDDILTHCLTHCDIYVPKKVVLAELIQGAKSEKEIIVMEDFIEAFHIIDQKEDTWLNAGRLSFSMKRNGLTVNIIDCYIAVMAKEKGCIIFSLDEHFKSIERFLHLKLFI